VISVAIILGRASIQFSVQLCTFKYLSLYVHLIIAVAFFVVAAWVWFIGSSNQIVHHSLIDQIWYSVFDEVTLYVYSVSVNGSTIFLSILSKFLITLSHIVHCIQVIHPLYVIFVPLSGIG
jgi:hypothetical protein